MARNNNFHSFGLGKVIVVFVCLYFSFRFAPQIALSARRK